MENKKAHLTAISRKKASVPMRYLAKQNLLRGKLLDYGCGKGMDAKTFNMAKYDKFYAPKMPVGLFDTITCNYVFNVVDKATEEFLIMDIKSKLNKNGTAYITVRRDVKRDGFTSKGTYQRNVELDLPKLKETSTYCTYIVTR